MLSIIKSMALNGLEGYLIHVQVDVSNGMPDWEIVGLPDTSVKESKERVKTAIKNTGYEFPSKRIVINLAPASTKKEGSIFDLPIAVGILKSSGIINCMNIEDYLIIGELSLDGKIDKVTGVLPICVEAKKLGIKNIIVPFENAKEAAVVKEVNIIPIKDIEQIVKYLNKVEEIEPYFINVNELFEKQNNIQIDFSEVKGQENIKRGLEIAAAGGHNCLLIGTPGSGKTMISRRIPTILPDLTFDEALEITKIHSISGILKDIALITKRPFRSPHHTISGISLIRRR